VIARNQISMHFRKQAEREQAAGGSTAHWGLQQIADGPPADPATDDHDKSGLYRSALELLRTDEYGKHAQVAADAAFTTIPEIRVTPRHSSW